MAKERLRPGQVRDTISAYLRKRNSPSRVREIHKHVESQLGKVPRSSVQSSLNLQSAFRRVSKGLYVFDDSRK